MARNNSTIDFLFIHLVDEMTTLTFDTHEFIKELKEAGFSEQQAEAITRLQKAAITGESATKSDLKDIELKIAESKADLIRWVFGVGVLQTSIIAGLILKLIH